MKKKSQKLIIDPNYLKAKNLIREGVQMLYERQPACDVFLYDLTDIINTVKLGEFKTPLSSKYGRVISSEELYQKQKTVQKAINKILSES